MHGDGDDDECVVSSFIEIFIGEFHLLMSL